MKTFALIAVVVSLAAIAQAGAIRVKNVPAIEETVAARTYKETIADVKASPDYTGLTEAEIAKLATVEDVKAYLSKLTKTLQATQDANEKAVTSKIDAEVSVEDVTP